MALDFYRNGQVLLRVVEPDEEETVYSTWRASKRHEIV
jgi:hypothetical protein